MGKHLDLANRYVRWLKPMVEDKTGIRLDDIIVRDISEYKPMEGSGEPLNPDTLMFVNVYYPNTIFMIEDCFDKMPYNNKIYTSVAHELAHIVHGKIHDEEAYRLFPPKREGEDYRSIPKKEIYREIISLARFLKNISRKSFEEGFAEYFSLDYILGMYDKRTRVFAEGRSESLLRYKLHRKTSKIDSEAGYNFFKEVLSIIGEDKLFEVARKPPISESEIKTPRLYLLRNYPNNLLQKPPELRRQTQKNR